MIINVYGLDFADSSDAIHLPCRLFYLLIAFTQVNFSNFISKGVRIINALKTAQKEIRLYTGVCDAVSFPRPFNVSYVTIKVNVLLECFDLVARYDTSHCSTDRFFLFFFSHER